MNNSETKGPVIGCFPLYPPEELIHALGLTPYVMWGFDQPSNLSGASLGHVQPFACGVVHRLVDFILSTRGEKLGGFASYNACDTLRNLPEILQDGLGERGRTLPWFHFHIPMTLPHQKESKAFLRAELDDLIENLEKTYEVKFYQRAFQQSVELFRTLRKRALLAENAVMNGTLAFADFSELVLGSLNLTVEERLRTFEHFPEHSVRIRKADHRIIVSGILPPRRKIAELFDSAGLRIVGNDIAALKRSYGYTPASVGSPAEYYGELYSNHLPCTTLLNTQDRRVDWLLSMIKEREAKGVVFLAEKFCEHEGFERPYLIKRLQELGISTLVFEVGFEDESNIEAIRTRLEAFVELMGKSS